ncbi:MAG: hypothetical protein KDD45_04545 [Bdellovibrionales bacterium]|nr:hypothetical protein [Bdellovibrionales bacterium]
MEPNPVETPEVYIPPPPTCDIPPPPPPILPPEICDPTLPTAPTYCPPPPPTFCDDKLSRKFTLSFEYACRNGVPFHSCSGNIVWNNEIILSIVPSDYAVHLVSIEVLVIAGDNSLQIEGTGLSNSYGLTVDNVKLVREGTLTNIVVNGGF